MPNVKPASTRRPSNQHNSPRATRTAPKPGKIALINTAFDAGLPVDSLGRFDAAWYTPQPRQLLFHAAARSADLKDGPVDIAYGGARGGGKTASVLAQLAIDDCQRQPNLKCLFLRKIGKAARESFEDVRRQLLMRVKHSYKPFQGQMVFPNGSRIVLGHFNSDKDIDQYLGLEYDVIAIEENTQLSNDKVKDIKTCLRTSKPNWRPRTYRTTNPGGISHAEFKKDFILPWRNHTETTSRFIPATVYDNLYTNPEYRANLESLTGWKRQAWLHGEWDIASGQYFTMWNYETHVCRPFNIPAWWPVWASMDYGFTHPTAVYLFTEFDGTVYVVAEHVYAKKLPRQHTDMIEALFLRHKVPIYRLQSFLAGADVFANRGDTEARTIADQYSDCGIELTAAPMDRVNGWGEILQRLGDKEKGHVVPPTLQVFETCVNLIECIPSLQHDPHHPEDVLKVDVDEDGNGGDDPADSLRYGLSVAQPVMLRPRTGGDRSKQGGSFSAR